jgi:VanZ family protein
VVANLGPLEQEVGSAEGALEDADGGNASAGSGAAMSKTGRPAPAGGRLGWSRRHAVVAWLWVGACVTAILTFSGEGFSAAQTGSYLRPLLEWIFPDLSPRQLRDVHFAVRKLAHLTEYGVLAALSLRALRLTLDVSLLRVAGLALCIVLTVAGVDELRQSFLPSRGGSVVDIGINLVGGSLGVLLVIAVHRLLGVGAPSPEQGT